MKYMHEKIRVIIQEFTVLLPSDLERTLDKYINK